MFPDALIGETCTPTQTPVHHHPGLVGEGVDRGGKTRQNPLELALFKTMLTPLIASVVEKPEATAVVRATKPVHTHRGLSVHFG